MRSKSPASTDYAYKDPYKYSGSLSFQINVLILAEYTHDVTNVIHISFIHLWDKILVRLLKIWILVIEEAKVSF